MNHVYRPGAVRQMAQPGHVVPAAGDARNVFLHRLGFFQFHGNSFQNPIIRTPPPPLPSAGRVRTAHRSVLEGHAQRRQLSRKGIPASGCFLCCVDGRLNRLGPLGGKRLDQARLVSGICLCPFVGGNELGVGEGLVHKDFFIESAIFRVFSAPPAIQKQQCPQAGVAPRGRFEPEVGPGLTDVNCGTKMISPRALTRSARQARRRPGSSLRRPRERYTL